MQVKVGRIVKWKCHLGTKLTGEVVIISGNIIKVMTYKNGKAEYRWIRKEDITNVEEKKQ